MGITLSGRVPGWALSRSGSGYGYGSGYGDGDGYGDGYGYGSGDGSGDGYGSGDGSGDGYGDGYGSGDGYGYGYGSGDGSGHGYGSGYGYGYGDGYGDGDDLERSEPIAGRIVTVQDLADLDACGEAVLKFRRAFPNGGRYPEDMDKASEAGLDLGWAREKLGLLPVISEKVA